MSREVTVRLWIPYAADHAFAHIPGWPAGEWVEAERALFPPSSEPVYDEHARYRLQSFAGAVPLVPGDIVWAEPATEGLTLNSIIELAPVWVFEVDTSTPQMMRAPGLDDPDNWDVAGFDDSNWEAAQLVADEVEKILGRATAVHRSTNHSVTLVTESREWFDRFVETNPHVTAYTVLREPGQVIDLDFALRDVGASLGHLPIYDKHGVKIS